MEMQELMKVNRQMKEELTEVTDKYEEKEFNYNSQTEELQHKMYY